MFHFDPTIRLGDLGTFAMVAISVITTYVRIERVLAELKEWRKHVDADLLDLRESVRYNGIYVEPARRPISGVPAEES